MYSRTTTSGMYGTLLGSLQDSLSHIQDLQRQLATNNKYARLSDNPSAVTRGLELESTLAATEKYMQNGQSAISMLNYSEGAMNTVLDAAQSIRDLVIQAGNGALGESELEDIVAQIEAKRQTIVDALNSKVAGQYIFGGTDTSTPPFSMTSDGRIVYNGSDERIKYALGDGLLGDVSFTGSEIIPTDEPTYFICSHKVPLDWAWTGREEKVQITVGNRTLAVFIPEQWVDEIASQKTEMSDYNQFRDPGEVSGISLDDLASLVNRSLQEQGADMLVTASVEKNMDTGEQQMFIKSNTGEKVGITGWTDTDYMPVCQSLEGLSFDKDDAVWASAPWSSNALIGDTELSLSGLAGKNLIITSGGTTKEYTFSADPSSETDLCTELTSDFGSLNIAATVQDGKLVLISQTGKDISVDGSAAQQLLGDASVSEEPEYSGITGTANVLDWRGGAGTLTITLDGETENFDLSDMGSISDLVKDINSKMPSDAGDLPVASIVSGRLVLQSTKGNFKVEGDANDLKNLLGTDGTETSVESSVSSLSVTIDTDTANTVKVYMNKDDGLEEIAEKINAIDGVLARTSTDGKKLVVVAQRVGDLPEDSLHVNEAEELKHYPSVTLQATGEAKMLFTFNDEGTIQSEPATRAVDHSHMDVFDVLGMETAMKSVEFAPDQKLTIDEDLHWRVMSGGHTADITLTSGEYTMTQLADRLKNAGAGWLEVTVDVVNPNSLNQDAGEEGVGTNDYEAATQRLVIRGYNGEQVLFLDMNEQHYADEMGLSTALRTEAYTEGTAGTGVKDVYFPQAPCVDDQLGVKVRVQMNCGMSYDVTLTKKDVADPATGLVNRRKVMEEIVKQVNAQEGETVMGVTIPLDDENKESDESASIYFLSGESFSVVDLPFSDPVWEDYSGGIAAQMGIHGGVTANLEQVGSGMKDSDTFGVSGTIRFSNLAHSVEIDVGENDTVKDVMDRLRSQAGDWLYVNYFDSHMGGAENGSDRQSGDYPILAISSVDGSAVSVVDVDGTDGTNPVHIAQDYLGLSTGIEGTVDLTDGTFEWNTDTTPLSGPADSLTLDVAGYEHTIDLTGMHDVNNDSKIDAKDMVEFINARMQDYDVQAGINEDGQLTVWSPRGYSIGISFADSNGDDVTENFLGTSGVSFEARYTLKSSDLTTTSTISFSYVKSDGTSAAYSETVEVSGTSVDLSATIAAINAQMTADGSNTRAELKDGNIILRSSDNKVSDVKMDTTDISAALFGENYYRGGYDLDEDADVRTSPGIHGQNATIRSGSNTTRQNAFGMLDDVIAAVKSGNRDALAEKMLPRVDSFINNVLGVLSSNGALVNRYDANMARQTNESLIMTDEYDKLMRPDYSEVASQLMLANHIYNANLAVISRLIQPSLLDFLS
ncbi:MAG: flagellar hook-associated protein FlgL [Fretibacterium sp.]|nr:flagellar hook-associated protein FlgL [Fretibacterium sp.]